MFAYTNYRFPTAQNSSQMDKKPVGIQNQNTVKRATYVGARNTAPPTSSVPRPGPKQRTDISESYKNRAYNRQPSPESRFVPPLSGAGRVRPTSPKSSIVRQTPTVRERSTQRPVAAKAKVTESRSDVIKRRLDYQCVRSEDKTAYTVKTRPKTADHKKENTLEEKVFHAVRDVLSRAVIENGRIDENNINSIFCDMKKQLMDDDSSDDSAGESEDINVNIKKSKTSVNIEPHTTSKTVTLAKSKMSTGIIRKPNQELSKNALHKYKRVYGQDETLLMKNGPVKAVLGEEPVYYIDLPDSDYSNFNSMVKKEQERKISDKKKSEETKPLHVINSKKDNYVEIQNESSFTGGQTRQPCENQMGDYDCQAKNESLPFSSWKPEDEIRLQTYIESMIRKMNDQLGGKPINESSNQFETENTVCKSFCVCKVCVSNKPSSNTVHNDTSVTHAVQDNEESKVQLRTSETRSNLVEPKVSKTIRKPAIFKKEVKKESNCKVLQKNKNFQPESKVNLSTRHVVGPKHTPSNSSYVVTTRTEDEGEDMYLQRRMKKFPAKRPLSSKK